MRSTQLNRTQNMPVKPKLYYWIYKNIMAQSTFSYWMSLHALTQVAWASICVLDDFNISNLLWRNASKKVSELPPISKPNFLTQHQCTCPHFQFYTIKATMPISGCPWAFRNPKTNWEISPNIEKLFLLHDFLHEHGDLIFSESKTIPLPADLSQAVQVAVVKLCARSKKILVLVKNYLRQKIVPQWRAKTFSALIIFSIAGAQVVVTV